MLTANSFNARFMARTIEICPRNPQAYSRLRALLISWMDIADSESTRVRCVNSIIDLDVMMEVIKASSGRNSAVDDKFPNFVNKGRFDAGFRNTLMTKDVSLFAKEAAAAGCLGEVGVLNERLWREYAEAAPGEDFTGVFKYLRDLPPA